MTLSMIDAMTLTERDVKALLVCPSCRGSLGWAPSHCWCHLCGNMFRVIDDIPVLLRDEAKADHDHIHEEHNLQHKNAQATYFDTQAAEEFEIERPNSGAKLYNWLMREKFRRSIDGLEHLVGNGIVLTVCGGSGMDAQFLCEAGACVISSDISMGAARRCRERARRRNLRVMPIVADVENLPFREQSIRLVYVHDGLHHLTDPMAGIREMARVARDGLSLTEPADASITSVAIRLGLAMEREGAGNRVARLELAAVGRAVQGAGFHLERPKRYAMFYRHEPGRWMRLFSRPGLLFAAQAIYRIGNVLAGRFGNKLAVKGLRPTLRSVSN